jgi:CheY-like chemotaxis protein
MTILFDNYDLNRFAEKMAGKPDAASSSRVAGPESFSPSEVGQGHKPSSETDSMAATKILKANSLAQSQGPFAQSLSGVLVVDDEELIREVLKRFLQLADFRVFLAANGHEAVELYRNEAAAIDAVLLDVRMPGIDGPATLGALRCLDPRVRCCFMSGDLGFHSPEELFRLGAIALFEKPLQMGALADTLRRVIGSPATTT